MPKHQVCQLHVGTTSEATASAFPFQQHSSPFGPKQDGIDLSVTIIKFKKEHMNQKTINLQRTETAPRQKYILDTKSFSNDVRTEVPAPCL